MEHRSYNHWQLWVQKCSLVFSFKSYKVILDIDLHPTAYFTQSSAPPTHPTKTTLKWISPGTPLKLTPWGDLTFILFTLVSCTWWPDFCALRASPLHHVLPQKASVLLHPHCRGVDSCTSARQSLNQAVSVDRRMGRTLCAAISHSVSPAHLDPSNSLRTRVPTCKFSFPSELSLSISTLDGRFKAT